MKLLKIPDRLGLCLEHGDDFWYPLGDSESIGCPVCAEEMVVYVRAEEHERVVTDLRVIIDSMSQMVGRATLPSCNHD